MSPDNSPPVRTKVTSEKDFRSDLPSVLLEEIDRFQGGINNAQDELSARIKECQISPCDEIPPPPVCLSIYNGVDYSVLGTMGNFSMVIGKAKSRKTFFIALASAAAVCQNEIFGRLKGTLPKNQNTVLYFDTEQSKYHVQKSLKRICSLSQIDDPANLQTYSIRKFSPVERMQIIETTIYSTPSVGFVVIDGIRDLITSINDEEQATEMSSRLLKWTEELNIHILCVLHQNKGDNNARGHIGTELQNKAETVLSITKDKEVSIVEAEFCRDKDFEPFAYEIDGDGLPSILANWSVKSETKRSSSNLIPNEMLAITHKQILEKVFARSPRPTYNELVVQLKLALNDEGKKIGDNKAKEFITWYANEGYILKPNISNTKKSTYTFNLKR